METNPIQEDVPGGVPLKMWTRGVPVEDEARRQLTNVARLRIVLSHVAAMCVKGVTGLGRRASPRRDDAAHALDKKKGLASLQGLLSFGFLGSPTWARTRDLRINSPALYRLSYRGKSLTV